MKTFLHFLLFLVATRGAMTASGSESDSTAWVYRTWQTEDGLPDSRPTGLREFLVPSLATVSAAQAMNRTPEFRTPVLDNTF